MAELHKTGMNRIAYKTRLFATGKTVTAYLWSPTLEKSALQTFTEIELGLYYLDYDFSRVGPWIVSFYEDGVAVTFGVYRVIEIGVIKNVALSNFSFLMVLSSDHITPAAGKTITAEISKDGEAFSACTNAVVELSNGFYKINLTQAEMNADLIALKFTEADCDQRSITMVTSS
ncbi:hypothetical protein ES707_11414 [subsurface metagenome]